MSILIVQKKYFRFGYSFADTFTICVNCLGCNSIFLIRKQTFNGLLKVIGYWLWFYNVQSGEKKLVLNVEMGWEGFMLFVSQ